MKFFNFIFLTLLACIFAVASSTSLFADPSSSNETGLDFYFNHQVCLLPLPSIFVSPPSYPLSFSLLSFDELLSRGLKTHTSENIAEADNDGIFVGRESHAPAKLGEYSNETIGQNFDIESFAADDCDITVSDSNEFECEVSSFVKEQSLVNNVVFGPAEETVYESIALPFFNETMIAFDVERFTPIFSSVEQKEVATEDVESPGESETVAEEISKIPASMPSLREIRKTRVMQMVRSLFKLCSMLALGVLVILAGCYAFICSIILYVSIREFLAEKFEAESNEHFRQLLGQIYSEQRFKEKVFALPAPPPHKMDQGQQTDIVQDGDRAFFPLDIDEESSETNVLMEDISQSVA